MGGRLFCGSIFCIFITLFKTYSAFPKFWRVDVFIFRKILINCRDIFFVFFSIIFVYCRSFSVDIVESIENMVLVIIDVQIWYKW